MLALVVDDSKVVRSFTAKILQELDIKYIEAVDGIDALSKLKGGEVDFILLDWNMPNMNGPEFLQELKKDPKYQEIPVIFCTNENEFSKIQQAMRIGASEYIMKPYDSGVIKDKLMQLGLL